jgi:hypothetical protein
MRTSRDNIDFEKLIEYTAQYMLSRNLTDLPKKDSCFQINSCWGILCIGMINRFDKITSLHIRTMWTRNIKNYRGLVIQILKNLIGDFLT